ncbi:hypothetical protein WBZ18_03280 [Clostridium botulinum]|uniref:hypothetical protein n=1 Tax=Clostridium botulinum TaxID=1491 RepID=UPI00339D718F
MLMFNEIYMMMIQIANYNLNTSYVNIQPILMKQKLFIITYLNTSYVDVQYYVSILITLVVVYLNTSYVNVQLKIL